MPKQEVLNWAAIFGRWHFDRVEARYQGPQSGQNAHLGNPFGLCLSDVHFSEGEARTSLELPAQVESTDAADRVDSNTSAYLLFGFSIATSVLCSYVLVGLAGYSSAYTIARYVPNRGWVPLALAGSRENLSPGRNYQIVARVQGQRVTLSVDGVRVLEHLLEEPIDVSQLGLGGWGQREVVFRNTTINQEPGKVFVVMKFSPAYQELYEDVIQPLCKRVGLEAYRADEVFGPGVVLPDIVRSIDESKIIIAEITAPDKNENIFLRTWLCSRTEEANYPTR